MIVLENANEVLTLAGAVKKDGRKLIPADLNILKNGSLVIDKEKIIWSGLHEKMPVEYQNLPRLNCRGYCLTPGIVDSHTHLVFAGNRANEYLQKINGEDYEKIAENGGGILATTIPTNEIEQQQLFFESCVKVERFISYGIKGLEIKSGYALTFQGEKKMTEVIDQLKKKYQKQITIKNTFMAAHAIPKNKTANEYLEEIVFPLIDQLHSKLDFIDIFHEVGYFDKDHCIQLFTKAKKYNIPVKIHADEFNDNDGAKMAVDFNAASADHLLQISDANIKTLSKSQTTATLLPGTSLFLGKPLARARKILDAGTRVALASDYNPGSCHCDNLLLLASIAAAQYKLNAAELWSAITYNAAHAMKLENQGALIQGMIPVISFFRCDSISEITYSWGKNLHDQQMSEVMNEILNS